MEHTRQQPAPTGLTSNTNSSFHQGNTNSSAALLLQLGGYAGSQHHQHQPAQQQYSSHQQQSSLPTQQLHQYPVIQSQPGQFLHFPGANSMTMAVGANANNIARMQFSERDRQIKRRTKTGCLTCRKRRIKVALFQGFADGSATRVNRFVRTVKSQEGNAKDISNRRAIHPGDQNRPLHRDSVKSLRRNIVPHPHYPRPCRHRTHPFLLSIIVVFR